MRRYLPVAGAGIHALLAYRATILLSAVTTGATAALQVFLWLAVYRAADGPMPLPLGSLISYVVLAQLLALLHANRVDDQVSGEVYRGDIAVSLVRPVSYPLTCLAASLPAAAVSAAVAGVPLLIIFALTTPMTGPTLTGVLLFAAAVPLGALIAFEVNLMVGLVAFVVTNTWGVRMVKSTVVGLLAGQIVPLTLLPDAVRRIVRLLPFQGMIDGPLRLLLGTYHGAGEAGSILAAQAIWVALLAGLTALVWRASVRRIEVLGG